MTQSSFLEDNSVLKTVNWKPNHEAALERLGSFLPFAGKSYGSNRGYDLGPEDLSNISALSPWIRHRLILETDVLGKVLTRHSALTAEKFVEEVFWRGYFKGWLEHRSQVWNDYRHSVVSQVDHLDRNKSFLRRYEEAITGNTGISCFDIWSQQLVETGYLHNHARMWYASIWIFTLDLPWELGADFFFRHLLDGDPASNTCSWRWVAGLHTSGKTYLAKPQNIEKYTNGRFYPIGEISATAEPRPGRNPSSQKLDFDNCSISDGKVGLILTEEDCSAHNLLPKEQGVTAAIALTNFTERSKLPSPEHVHKFSEGAVASAANMYLEVHGLECEVATGLDWGSLLTEWVERKSIDVLVTAKLTVGPVKRRLQRACSNLSVPLVEITRAYDQYIWPNTKGGFFLLKKKIPYFLKNWNFGENDV